jgi:hypothetical protein
MAATIRPYGKDPVDIYDLFLCKTPGKFLGFSGPAHDKRS